MLPLILLLPYVASALWLAVAVVVGVVGSAMLPLILLLLHVASALWLIVVFAVGMMGSAMLFLIPLLPYVASALCLAIIVVVGMVGGAMLSLILLLPYVVSALWLIVDVVVVMAGSAMLSLILVLPHMASTLWLVVVVVMRMAGRALMLFGTGVRLMSVVDAAIAVLDDESASRVHSLVAVAVAVAVVLNIANFLTVILLPNRVSCPAMSQPAVDVSGFSPLTSKSELHNFFSFGGKIKSIELKDDEGESDTAVITFEKHSAAHTALMLNGCNLGGNTLTVTLDVECAAHADIEEHPLIEQSDKPRASIAAEYLSKGYKLSDHILQRATEIDNKRGTSQKFFSFISDLDKSVGHRALGPQQTVSGKFQSSFKEVHTRVKSVDEQNGYSKWAQEYYSKALSSSIGKSVLSFYAITSEQVWDIHEEAVRIKGLKGSPTPTLPPTVPAESSK